MAITRNSYGAKCLNSPDVLFADIDFDYSVSVKIKLLVGLLLLISVIWYGTMLPGGCPSNKASVLGMALVVILISSSLVNLINKVRIKKSGGIVILYRRRIYRFISKHPQWNLRLYRTPAGLRLIATHQLFDALDEQVFNFFQAIGTDPLYVRMCINQRCFRARLTAKPWRIDISNHMKPRPGVWPVKPKRLAERTAWLACL